MPKPEGPLRRGWTTGACATAAAKAAYSALLHGDFPDPVAITLPKGQTPTFALNRQKLTTNEAMATVIKDAGDDPDVTHGAEIMATVKPAASGSGIVFMAGPGVGTVTRPGLMLDVGEPAINPVPRKMITTELCKLAAAAGTSADLSIEISIPNGEKLAEKTMNGRLGILGGLSILGTTGIVIPYSCSAWIASIHQAVDVARAEGIDHLGAATGSTSEAALIRELGLSEDMCIEMGDFAGGLLKYLRRNPLKRLTLAGGFAKLSKLADGHMDLHSARSSVDFDFLAGLLSELGANADLVAAARQANTAAQVLEMAVTAGLPLADQVARQARHTASELCDQSTGIVILVTDRSGNIVGRADD